MNEQLNVVDHRGAHNSTWRGQLRAMKGDLKNQVAFEGGLKEYAQCQFNVFLHVQKVLLKDEGLEMDKSNSIMQNSARVDKSPPNYFLSLIVWSWFLNQIQILLIGLKTPLHSYLPLFTNPLPPCSEAGVLSAPELAVLNLVTSHTWDTLNAIHWWTLWGCSCFCSRWLTWPNVYFRMQYGWITVIVGIYV